MLVLVLMIIIVIPLCIWCFKSYNTRQNAYKAIAAQAKVKKVPCKFCRKDIEAGTQYCPNCGKTQY
jgi:hypothetical protein